MSSSASLAICQRVTAGCAAKSVRGCAISIWRSTAVLGIVPPCVTGISRTVAAPRWQSRGAVPAPDIAAIPISDVVAIAAVYIGVAVEIVIVVDVNVVSAPTTSPAPTAAPECPHRHSDAERNRHSRGIVTGGRIVNRWIGIDGGAIHHHWIIRRDVDDIWTCLLDDDDTLTLDDFCFYFLLFR